MNNKLYFPLAGTLAALISLPAFSQSLPSCQTPVNSTFDIDANQYQSSQTVKCFAGLCGTLTCVDASGFTPCSTQPVIKADGSAGTYKISVWGTAPGQKFRIKYQCEKPS